MPDEFGRLTLLEIRQYILRNLAALQATSVDPTSGVETAPLMLGLNVQFSADNLNLRINSSTTKVACLINANNEKIFSKEITLDAIPGVTQYELPPDFCQIRGLWWLDPSIDSSVATPENYVPMSYQDPFEDGGLITGVNFSRPTWRLVGNVVQLNQDPGDWLSGVHAGGFQLRYIQWTRFLNDDDDYLHLMYAQVAQEVIVWDVTLDCVRSQEEVVDATGVEKSLAMWQQQLEILIRNEYRPPEIRLIGPSMVKGTFSGR